MQDLMRRSEESVKKEQLYFHKNGLLLNAKNTPCMFVGTRGLLSQIPPDTYMQVDENLLILSISLKSLGKHLNSHMQFDTHINKLNIKIYRTIMYIKKLRDNFNKNTTISVIQSLGFSVISYGINMY